MILWWIGNALLVAVVVPLLVALLNRLGRPALEIRAYAAEIAAEGRRISFELEALRQLERTPGLLRDAGTELERYMAAVDELERRR